MNFSSSDTDHGTSSKTYPNERPREEGQAWGR